MKKSAMILVGIWLAVSLACNLPGTTPAPQASQPPSEQPSIVITQALQAEQEGQPMEIPTEAVIQVQPEESTQNEPQAESSTPSDPVSINEGLASLNSYVLSMKSKFLGPKPQDQTIMDIEIQRSKEPDATYTHVHSISSSVDSPEADESDTYTYLIGTEQCSGSDEDWTYEAMTDAQKEMVDLFKDMLEIKPLIDNPSFVGMETMNDIPANHFAFQLSGVGVKSGAEVTSNQGDYWLAQDGQYILRYTLLVETRSGPESDILHSEIFIDLNQINQPVSISFPQGCLDAKNSP